MKKEIKELSDEELNCVDGGDIFDDLAKKVQERQNGIRRNESICTSEIN